MPEQKLRGHLGSFGVTGNLALQPMYTLSGIFPRQLHLVHSSQKLFSVVEQVQIIGEIYSLTLKSLDAIEYLCIVKNYVGGQKSRVAFAKITFKKPHIILLDEPSNHLVTSCSLFLLPAIRGLVLDSS